MTVVTGPSRPGKSSLVFDTLYAEGQRRYVETFSAYARQFLDRMDRPQVERVDGVPPAIAIDQTNPVRSSRSTVGTMTELNDHLKLLYARAGCSTARPRGRCGTTRRRRSTRARRARRRTIRAWSSRSRSSCRKRCPMKKSRSGCRRAAIRACRRSARSRRPGPRKVLDVVADRFRVQNTDKVRVVEAIEASLKRGGGRVNVYVLPADAGNAAAEPQVWRFSTGLHDPDSDLRYAEPQAALFSFNSAYGACETCRGFGRVIGVDLGLVIPDARKTLRGGAIKPMQTPPGRSAGRPDALRGESRHPARHAVVRAVGRRARLGRQRVAGLERQVAEPVVRREALLRLSRVESVQDAYPRAAVEIPQLRRATCAAARA